MVLLQWKAEVSPIIRLQWMQEVYTAMVLLQWKEEVSPITRHPEMVVVL